MTYQPWYVTQTYPSWTIPLNVEGNADNISGISSSALTMIFHPTVSPPSTDFTGTGTFAIVTSNPAVVMYTPSAGDVTSKFTGDLFVKVVFPSGGTAIYDPIPFSITDI